MAVDVYADNFSGIMSPRISFSHDLEENNRNHQITPCRLDHTLLLDTTPFDFAFNIESTSFLPSSTADELFCNGRILPTGINKQEEETETTTTTIEQKTPVAPCLDPQKKSLKEFLEDDDEEEEPNASAKSFWKFRRSNSLNCDKKKSWKILSRSGSTGKFLGKIVEEDEPEKGVSIRTFWKFGIIGNGSHLRRSSSLNCTISGALNRSESDNHLSRSKSTGHGSANGKSIQNRQIKNIKIHGYGNGNGNNSNCNKYRSIKVSPILNLPSPYISRVSVDLFGFGSFFCNGSNKDRKKKKFM